MHRTSRLLPETVAGRWSLGLYGLGLAGFLSMIAAVALGQRGGDTFSDNWWLAAPALLAGIGVASSALAGCYAILRDHERAVIVYFTTALGLLVMVFAVGEATAQH